MERSTNTDLTFPSTSDLADSALDIDLALNITDVSSISASSSPNVVVRPSNVPFAGRRFPRVSSLPNSPSKSDSARKRLTFQDGDLGTTIPPRYNFDFRDGAGDPKKGSPDNWRQGDETWRSLSEGIGSQTPGGFSLVNYQELRRLWEEIQQTKLQTERDIQRSLDNLWSDSPQKAVVEEPCVVKKVTPIGDHSEDDTLNNVESIHGSHPNDAFGPRSPNTAKSGPGNAVSGTSDAAGVDVRPKKKVEFALGSGIPQFLRPQTRHVHVDDVSSWPADHVNLGELWGDQQSQEPQRLGKKLAEEQCRRQLCERMIQQLQIHLLEEKEKVAVAVEVDRHKTAALRESEHANQHGIEERRRTELELKRDLDSCRKEKQELGIELKEHKKRVQQYEQELSKALDLAEVFKTKLERAEKEKAIAAEAHRAEVTQLQGQLQKAEEHSAKLLEENNRIAAKRKEATLEVERRLEQVRLTEEQRLTLEDATGKLAQEKEHLENRLQQETKRAEMLDSQLKGAQAELKEVKSKEGRWKEGLKQCEEKVEAAREEIHKFYQQQVERIVSEKVGELDQERNRMQEHHRASVSRLQEKYEQNLKEFRAKSLSDFESLEQQYKLESENHRRHRDFMVHNLEQVISWVAAFKARHTCPSQQFQEAILDHLNQTMQQLHPGERRATPSSDTNSEGRLNKQPPVVSYSNWVPPSLSLGVPSHSLSPPTHPYSQPPKDGYVFHSTPSCVGPVSTLPPTPSSPSPQGKPNQKKASAITRERLISTSPQENGTRPKVVANGVLSDESETSSVKEESTVQKLANGSIDTGIEDMLVKHIKQLLHQPPKNSSIKKLSKGKPKVVQRTFTGRPVSQHSKESSSQCQQGSSTSESESQQLKDLLEGFLMDGNKSKGRSTPWK